jgi:hypothetical protein
MRRGRSEPVAPDRSGSDIPGGPAARLGRKQAEVPKRLFDSLAGEAGGHGGAGQRHPAQPEIAQDASRRAIRSDGRIGRFMEPFGHERVHRRLSSWKAEARQPDEGGDLRLRGRSGAHRSASRSVPMASGSHETR